MFAAAMCLLTSGVVSAQESDKGKLKSYSYLEVQGGGQITLTDAKMDKLITPMGAISFGHYFTPVVGARLHVSGWESKSGFDNVGYYKYNYITTNADLLLNLTNLVCNKGNGSHFLNVIFVGGIGLTNAWGNDDANKMAAANHNLNMPLVWDGNRLSHNIRAGLRLETNVTKPFGVALEVAANSLDDRFNSKYNNTDDWMITASLGLSYRFGHKYRKPAPKPAPVVETVAPEPAPKPTPKPVTRVVKRTVEKKVPVELNEVRFYKLREANADGEKAQMQRVADFLKSYPTATVSVVGYADKGTGNPKLNVKYAKQRADKYKEALVKDYGADASRIVTDSKGDTVQPFEDNDKNRCVIVKGQAEKIVTETIEETVTEPATE